MHECACHVYVLLKKRVLGSLEPELQVTVSPGCEYWDPNPAGTLNHWAMSPPSLVLIQVTVLVSFEVFAMSFKVQGSTHRPLLRWNSGYIEATPVTVLSIKSLDQLMLSSRGPTTHILHKMSIFLPTEWKFSGYFITVKNWNLEKKSPQYHSLLCLYLELENIERL